MRKSTGMSVAAAGELVVELIDGTIVRTSLEAPYRSSSTPPGGVEGHQATWATEKAAREGHRRLIRELTAEIATRR